MCDVSADFVTCSLVERIRHLVYSTAKHALGAGIFQAARSPIFDTYKSRSFCISTLRALSRGLVGGRIGGYPQPDPPALFLFATASKPFRQDTPYLPILTRCPHCTGRIYPHYWEHAVSLSFRSHPRKYDRQPEISPVLPVVWCVGDPLLRDNLLQF